MIRSSCFDLNFVSLSDTHYCFAAHQPHLAVGSDNYAIPGKIWPAGMENSSLNTHLHICNSTGTFDNQDLP